MDITRIGGITMSKIVKATCEIREVEPDILERAIELYAKHHHAEVNWLQDERVEVKNYDGEYWMDAIIGIKNDQIEVKTDDMFMRQTKDIIEQYYVAVDVAEEYDTEPEMNEKGELVLELEVM
jgi:hypothetical protein